MTGSLDIKGAGGGVAKLGLEGGGGGGRNDRVEIEMGSPRSEEREHFYLRGKKRKEFKLGERPGIQFQTRAIRLINRFYVYAGSKRT